MPAKWGWAALWVKVKSAKGRDEMRSLVGELRNVHSCAVNAG